jgi:hypothetical protein
MKNSNEPATFRFVTQSHRRAPNRTVPSSFKQLVMLQLFTVPVCYRQLDNISSDSSIQLSCCLMMGQYGPKHVAVSAFCNITVNLTESYALVWGLNYSNRIAMRGMYSMNR